MTEDTTTKMLFQTKWLINRDISHQIKDGKLLDDSKMNQRDNEHEEKHDNGPHGLLMFTVNLPWASRKDAY